MTCLPDRPFVRAGARFSPALLLRNPSSVWKCRRYGTLVQFKCHVFAIPPHPRSRSASRSAPHGGYLLPGFEIRLHPGRHIPDFDEPSHRIVAQLEDDLHDGRFFRAWTQRPERDGGDALPACFHALVHAEPAVFRQCVPLVASHLLAVAHLCGLPGLQTGRASAERALGRRLGRSAFRVPSHSRGIGELRFGRDGPVGYTLLADLIPRLFTIP